MLSGILGAAFLQSAGRAGKGEPVGKIILDTQFANPTIVSISCTGEIKVSSIYNGEPLVETYSDLDGAELSIQADANTKIMITGNFTDTFNISGSNSFISVNIKNTSIEFIDCNTCYYLHALDLSNNNSLTNVNCSTCYNLQSIDLSKNILVEGLDIDTCTSLQKLNLSKNSNLIELSGADILSIRTIYYIATNSDVSTAIARMITNADSTTGTVYTDSAAAYYSTIADAATAKGWTIAQLPA